MIRSLRTTHRWLWTLLALLLPALLWAALTARVEPVADGLPPELAEQAADMSDRGPNP
ncbi:MAG: hypothetical protein MPN21_01225 [Thermoanaerobaculia bacterium]|nr:hypothetical protein [Thermoanaerobaculia bacterium]